MAGWRETEFLSKTRFLQGADCRRRNVVNFRRRLERNIDLYRAGRITFADLDASVQGWINHVRYADTWRLRGDLFGSHPLRGGSLN
jgi:hypothetical protein